jgi:hypothetical protein
MPVNLHYPLPDTVEDEWAFNQALSAFLQGPEQLFCPPEDVDVLRRHAGEIQLSGAIGP